MHKRARSFTGFHGLFTGFHGLFTVVAGTISEHTALSVTVLWVFPVGVVRFTLVHGVSRPVHGVSRFVHGSGRHGFGTHSSVCDRSVGVLGWGCEVHARSRGFTARSWGFTVCSR